MLSAGPVVSVDLADLRFTTVTEQGSLSKIRWNPREDTILSKSLISEKFNVYGKYVVNFRSNLALMFVALMVSAAPSGAYVAATVWTVFIPSANRQGLLYGSFVVGVFMPKSKQGIHDNVTKVMETVSSRAQRAGQGEDTTENSFTIGQLAREFDVTLRTLRFYEDRGLVSPRRDGTTRIYSRRDRARLKLVLMGKKVGFSLTEIREMLDLYDLKDGQVVQLRVALKRFQEQVDVLREQRNDIEQAIEELERTVDVVAGMLREKETASS